MIRFTRAREITVVGYGTAVVAMALMGGILVSCVAGGPCSGTLSDVLLPFVVAGAFLGLVGTYLQRVERRLDALESNAGSPHEQE